MARPQRRAARPTAGGIRIWEARLIREDSRSLSSTDGVQARRRRLRQDTATRGKVSEGRGVPQGGDDGGGPGCRSRRRWGGRARIRDAAEMDLPW
ncbi:leucine-rich repeat extensin-like protein 3 [Iris pallida]|uniref:Leucine-rich repeat extensin-like protein 3 n=1 Tax=Iris pallida TaxID=29817 RepID=A0AAX6I7D0_IRIPA|nr:leucine-rich repeat extensin-like protein 3 [Iris pallida]